MYYRVAIQADDGATWKWNVTAAAQQTGEYQKTAAIDIATKSQTN